MNDARKPEWMRKKEAEQVTAAKEREVRRQIAESASLLIERDGQRFWNELKEELKIAVEFLPDLKLTGTISPTVDDEIRVTISKPGVSLNQTYTTLFYHREAKAINCGVLNGGIFSLLFCIVNKDHVAVVRSLDDPRAMDPEAAAQYVMERMIDYIESH